VIHTSPERLSGEVLTTRRYTNRQPFSLVALSSRIKLVEVARIPCMLPSIKAGVGSLAHSFSAAHDGLLHTNFSQLVVQLLVKKFSVSVS